MADQRFQSPWQPVTSSDEAAALAQELQKEIADGHPLSGLRVVAIGRRYDADDVLFAIED